MSKGRAGKKNFTEDKRCAILADFLEGIPDKEIAAKYGCVESYPRVLARRAEVSRQRSARALKNWKKKRETKEKRDWLYVDRRHHLQRERVVKRDWIRP